MNVLSELNHRLTAALAPLVDNPAPWADMVRPSQDPKFGDYQANCAMPLAKQLSKPPRDVAAEIVRGLKLEDICHEPEIAGPGFINFRLRDDWLASQLTAAVTDERLGVGKVEQPRTYIVDYSSPNVAKPMHVGHIRSTVIGDSLSRTLRFAGHQVITDNHLGDWGTQFGMIIYGYRHFRDEAAYEKKPLDELARLYRLVHQLIDYHDAERGEKLLAQKIREQEQAIAQDTGVAEANPQEKKRAEKARRQAERALEESRQELKSLQAKRAAVEADPLLSKLAREYPDIGRAVLEETAKLHVGDAENIRLWKQFMPPCLAAIEEIYRRLNVSFDVALGESFYHDRLGAVVADLRKKDLARESEGAICVFLPGHAAPMIVQKKDGAFLYATTDLATIQYRFERWKPDAILYVVDHRQSEHFAQLFAAARMWGYEAAEFQHISFGTVLGEDGRPFKTRSGDTVGLGGLLDEAVRRAFEVVSANDDRKEAGAELSPEQRTRIAEIVGIAALKYADLSQNRTSDYTFSYDKMLALNGNTATYMQYAYARVRNIFARGKVDIDALREARIPLRLDHAAERALGLELLRFSEAIELALSDYRPNQLTNYLFELANRYSTFYEECPVLKAETEAARTNRLLLCDLTARTLKQGLALLGIEVVEKM